MNKVCKICGKEKSLDQFYFRKDQNKYRNECKKCLLDMEHKRLENPITKERIRLYNYNRIRTEKAKAKVRECYHKYKEKHKERINNYKREKRKNDINFKLKSYLRSRIYDALKRNAKSSNTIELLGCSIDFLKGYLEAKFQFGMTWNNYGQDGWVIDHIKPCCSFDLSDPKQQNECFHYSNLQPLWKIENIIKGGRYA